MLGRVHVFDTDSLSLEYIQIIMTLEESVQHVVMTAIQEVSLARVFCYFEYVLYKYRDAKKKKW